MKKYKVVLGSGKTRVYKAKTPKQARHKYYASGSHFKTEDYVKKVLKYKPKKKC